MTISIPVVVMVSVFGLLIIGLYGLLTTRNLIKVIIALQIMMKGAIIAFVLAGRQAEQINMGQNMALTLIVADTIIAVIGLALAVQVRRHFGTLDIKAISSLRR